MTKGRIILRQIKNTHQSVMSLQQSIFDKKISQNKQLEQLQKQEVAALTQIAKIRIHALKDGEIEEQHDFDKPAIDFLARLDTNEEKLNQQISKIHEILEKQSQIYRDAEAEFTELEATYIAGKNDVYEQIEADKTYQQEIIERDALLKDLENAQSQLEISKTECAAKLKPYEQDAFFMHLQDRRYGTGEAKGWLLTQWLDKCVAQLYDYKTQTLNYHHLCTMPQRMAIHVEMLENILSKQISVCEKIEQNFLDAAGLDVIKSNMQKLAKDLEIREQDILSSMDSLEKRQHDLQEYYDLKIGADSDVVKYIREALAELHISELDHSTTETRSKTDDHLVKDIRYYQKQIDEIAEDTQQADIEYDRYMALSQGLEDLIVDFKDAEFHHSGHSFDDSRGIERILKEYLDQDCDKHDVWRYIIRTHHFDYENSNEYHARQTNIGGAILEGVVEGLVSGAVSGALYGNRGYKSRRGYGGFDFDFHDSFKSGRKKALKAHKKALKNSYKKKKRK